MEALYPGKLREMSANSPKTREATRSFIRGTDMTSGVFESTPHLTGAESHELVHEAARKRN